MVKPTKSKRNRILKRKDVLNFFEGRKVNKSKSDNSINSFMEKDKEQVLDKKAKNIYKQFIEETGQALRFTSWRFHKKIEKKKIK